MLRFIWTHSTRVPQTQKKVELDFRHLFHATKQGGAIYRKLVCFMSNRISSGILPQCCLTVNTISVRPFLHTPFQKQITLFTCPSNRVESCQSPIVADVCLFAYTQSRESQIARIVWFYRMSHEKVLHNRQQILHAS